MANTGDSSIAAVRSQALEGNLPVCLLSDAAQTLTGLTNTTNDYHQSGKKPGAICIAVTAVDSTELGLAAAAGATVSLQIAMGSSANSAYLAATAV